MRGCVQRLHRRMREIGNLVERLDQFGRLRKGRVDVAMAAPIGERPIERGAIFGGELSAVGRAGGAEVPFDRHRVKRFLGAPEIVGDDRHAIGHRQRGENATPFGDGGKVVSFELAAGHRAIGDSGIGHAGQTRVDAEARRAGGFQRRVDALDLLADQLELGRRLDRGLRGQRDPGGVRRKLAEGRREVRGLMPYDAAPRDARGRRHIPPRRARGDEPRAGGGAHLLQKHPRTAHRARASGAHRLIDVVVDEIAVGGGVFDLHLGEIAFQLFRQDHRHRGEHTLAHVGLGDAQRHGIVRVDDDKGVDLVGRLAGLRTPRLAIDGGRAGEFGGERRDRQASGGREADLDEGASGESDRHRLILRSWSVRRRDAPRRACADRSRSGRCWTSQRQCRRRSGADCAKAARPPP